jgi:hypothetical protein
VAILSTFFFHRVSVWTDQGGRGHRFICIFEVIMYWFKYLFVIVVSY